MGGAVSPVKRKGCATPSPGSTPFARGETITPENVKELLDLTVPADPSYNSMAELQYEGIAALYNILCKEKFAYLADEVGMGKTYQALGVAAIVWSLDPNARVLFISPRQSLQKKWFDEYARFFKNNYRRGLGAYGLRGDDRVTSALLGYPTHTARLYHRLREWVVDLASPHASAAFLRHTSFMRPVYTSRIEDELVAEEWSAWQEVLRGWGLHRTSSRPGRATSDNASREFNLEFARAFNAMIREHVLRDPSFDLVVIDEAQCLRNPDNQTNEVLHRMFRNRVGRWLFLSATPVHSGPDDLRRILNHYPCSGEVIGKDEVDDPDRLQTRMLPVMVRRQRRYVVDDRGTQVSKRSYRVHARDEWSEQSISPMATLAMGLVQKRLVEVLAGQNNRYRIGFLSSFESLQSSLRTAATASKKAASSEDRESDWHRDRAARLRRGETAPDSDFVNGYASDFRKEFGFSLPHPKIDRVVDEIAPRAFGEGDNVGGEKFLVFTRRISTVDELRDRLEQRHLRSVEDRIRRCWKQEIDWPSGLVGDALEDDDEEEPTENPEYVESESGRNPFRRAMAKGNWLYRFQQTFRRTGRNALFFEENWLARLCAAGGVDPAAAAGDIPDDLWRRSWTFASRTYGKKTSQLRAHRMRYLAFHALRESPSVFGLSACQAGRWLAALRKILPDKTLAQACPSRSPHKASDLFGEPTLWSAWDACFGGSPDMALPGAGISPGQDEMYERRVLQTLIGQTLRLTDAVLDIYCADRTSADKQGFINIYLNWLGGGDTEARRLRRVCANWIQNLHLVVDNCLDRSQDVHKGLSDLASASSFGEFTYLRPVIGVTGSSKGSQTAIRQFRSPTYPQVVVCTDTLKEGVDLHLFCDQVAHYGVAWTSGDLEQRVGRVDRYFSQIERRLRRASDKSKPKLMIYYPHVRNSLERAQVERVIRRQREAERLLDSPLKGTADETRFLTVDDIGSDGVTEHCAGEEERDTERNPFGDLSFVPPGRSVVSVTPEEATLSRDHYEAWADLLCEHLQQLGHQVQGRRDGFTSPWVILVGEDRRRVKVEWRFEPELALYTLSFTPSPWDDTEGFSAGRWQQPRPQGGDLVVERFFRVAVPRSLEPGQEVTIERIASWLEGKEPQIDETASRSNSPWNEALSLLTLEDGHHWARPHRCEARVTFSHRGNRVVIYAYDGIARVVSPIGPPSSFARGERWGAAGEPTQEAVRAWSLRENQNLALGFLDIHHRDGLCYGVLLGLADWSAQDRANLIKLVALRADRYEAALVGEDRQ